MLNIGVIKQIKLKGVPNGKFTKSKTVNIKDAD